MRLKNRHDLLDDRNQTYQIIDVQGKSAGVVTNAKGINNCGREYVHAQGLEAVDHAEEIKGSEEVESEHRN
jgi:hypothetical protein